MKQKMNEYETHMFDKRKHNTIIIKTMFCSIIP
jgi:hypothetical protein